MGSICSKKSYDEMAHKKSKKKTSEKLADLDKTMRDGFRFFIWLSKDIHPHKESHHNHKQEKSAETKPSQPSLKDKKRMWVLHQFAFIL